MNRRDFIKYAGILGFTLTHAPFLFTSTLKAKEIVNIIKGEINFQPASPMPVVINIFLYGGPSELAANLTNIEEINKRSQNPYPKEVLPPGNNNSKSSVTPNWFWGNAGGYIMEELIKGKTVNGIEIFPKSMSIYRTVYRRKDDNKSHPISITQNLVGNLDINKPGYAAMLASILFANNPWNKDINTVILPFVSLEGDSKVFKEENLSLPLTFKPVMLDSRLNNPYQRNKIKELSDADFQYVDSIIEKLALETSSTYDEYTKKIKEAFSKRKELAEFISSKLQNIDSSLPKSPNQNATPDQSDTVNFDPDVDQNGYLKYPDGKSNPMAQYLKVAISLAIENKDTVFISVGNGDLGSWDDHSDAIDRYKARMNKLMVALRCAVKHMYWYSLDTTKPPENRDRARRIVINIFGDFGRNVNLNNSMGWDHGNNQNFYTVGGWNIPGRVLGKLVGKTEVFGTGENNRLFTRPTADSYSFEPFSIISTVYKYFGVQNPEVITGEPPIDEQNPPNEFV